MARGLETCMSLFVMIFGLANMGSVTSHSATKTDNHDDQTLEISVQSHACICWGESSETTEKNVRNALAEL